ncbi:MAG: RHS repeat protein, partial [Desulfobacterales bacterium]|nr:RHS repeat protein [Desulfobacterales bacterium]
VWFNSRSARVGGLGPGWSHTYEAFLEPSILVEGAEFLRITDPSGRGSYFMRTDAETYKGFYNPRGEVRRMEDGKYIWKNPDGLHLGFTSGGKLEWMDDPAGNRLAIAHDAWGRPETVTDVSGARALTFIYGSDGFLESVLGPVTPATPDGIWVSYGRDALGNPTSVTYADGSGFDYTYTDLQELTEKRDRLGRLLNTWSHDDQDRCIQTTTRDGRGVSVDFTDGDQVEVTDAYDVVRAWLLETIGGRRVAVELLQGPAWAPYDQSGVVRRGYDAAGRLVELEYANGALHCFEDWDENDNPGRVTLAKNTAVEREIRYTWHPDLNTPLTRAEESLLGPGDKIAIHDYDNDGDEIPNEEPTGLLHRLIQRGYTRGASGEVVAYEYITTLEYNDKGQVIAMDGPLPGDEDRTVYTHVPANGDLISATPPLLAPVVFSDYDAAGRPGRITDSNNQTRALAYDGRGRMTSVTHEGDGGSSTMAFDAAGQPLTRTDADQISRYFQYDAARGRLERVTDMTGAYTGWGYDAQGNITSRGAHDADGVQRSITYRSYQHPTLPGKLWKTTKSNGDFMDFDYDDAGRLIEAVDYERETTTYTYDAHYRKTKVTRSNSADTLFDYDAHGNLSSVTAANNLVTTYQHDDMGRRIATLSTDTGQTTYTYDQAGRPASKTDAKGATATYTHDALNRLTGVHYADPGEDVSYTYDNPDANGAGRLTAMADPSGTTAFTYDQRGRLIGKDVRIGPDIFSLTRAYTPGGRVLSEIFPTGRALNFTRDVNGKVESISTTAYGGSEVKTLL